MTRQTRPLWQDSRSELTWQSLRDFLVGIFWGAGTAYLLLWRWV
jgi:hypothetical protein